MEDTRQTTHSAPFRCPVRLSKVATVTKLLLRNRAEIMEANHWQPHSARSFLSGIRKKRELLKETRRTGETSYRLTN